jgi:hypothetical protein
MTGLLPAASFALLGAAAVFAAEDSATIGYATVGAALQALRSDPTARFETQQQWIVVASSEAEQPVQWFFTPPAHPAHPSVIKRTAVERGGQGFIDIAVLCQVEQAECERLLDDFRQTHEYAARPVLAEEVLLEVGIAMNRHDRVQVRRMLAEEGKAAEIRMDDLLKIVIVPTLDEARRVLLWAAVYEHDGRDFVLVSPPTFAEPGDGTGTAQISVASSSGNLFDFSITTLLASASE